MFIVTEDRTGDKHFIATDMIAEIARGTVRKLVSQGRDFEVSEWSRDGKTVTVWARHEPELTNRWWDGQVKQNANRR